MKIRKEKLSVSENYGQFFWENLYGSERIRRMENIMASIWKETINMPEFPELNKDIRTQVLIIGGGMTGLLCAYFLQQAGVDYCLLEKNQICSEITQNTTAKITSQHGLFYDMLIRKEGVEKAGRYRSINELAVKYYRDIGRNIDCDLEERDAYVYLKDEKEPLEKEVEALKKLGAEAEFVSNAKLDLPFQTVGAVRVPAQLQFHPLKFAAAIAQNLHIYEHSEVREMTEYFALTKKGSVAAKKVIIATHFPFINKRGSYFLKMYQERALVLALKNAPKLEGMYMDGEKTGLTFRSWNDLLIVGGKSHRSGKKGYSFEQFRQEVTELLPDAKITAEWTAQDCMSLDKMPYIGPYSRSTPDLFVGTGYNKWGMTGAMTAALLLSDLVQEKENLYASLFSPGRNIVKPQLACNIWEAFIGLLRPSHGHRCPHMGCVLQWNAEEKTWECPCHGSRFDSCGKVLDNPAVDGIKKKS